jgi:hypothetical protein
MNLLSPASARRAWPAMLCAAVLWALSAPPAAAVTAVNPFGVNVRSSGATTVFLTFQSLDVGESAVEAFWCGELQPQVMAANPSLQLPFAVQFSNPCLPGTVYGRLPLALDRSRTSSSGGVANLSDIMTIPASVSRRAYQDAAAGLNSAFFYVRRFVGPAGERFVVVTCRMAGGGARTPLALLDVRLAFQIKGTPPTVLVLARGQTPPPLRARVRYNGNGSLRGRWELVRPGDPEPTEDDLLTEATLPPEQRALQRRYTLVSRFDLFLPPTGEATIPGPDPARLQTDADGAYKLLLRIEASDDKEATSNTGGGRLAVAGGVAGFPMPVLRYVVSGSADGHFEPLSDSDAPRHQGMGHNDPLLLLPAEGAQVDSALAFAWIDPPAAGWQRLEVWGRHEGVDDPTGDGSGALGEALSALVKPGTGRYDAPPWFVQARRGQTLRWRVQSLDARGRASATSAWRAFSVHREAPGEPDAPASSAVEPAGQRP